MPSWQPEERVRVPAARQRWSLVTFVHFGYEPAAVEALLPDGLRADTFDGLAWVGLTPFRLEASVLPMAPWPRVAVGEANVRTYVRSTGGRDGIWFLSLDLDQPVVATGLRLALRLPYRWARVDVDEQAGLVRYQVRRRGSEGSGELTVAPGVAIRDDDLTDLDVFLVARWRAFTRLLGAGLTVPVEHPPWPLHRAELPRLDGDLLASLGLGDPVTGPHARFSPGVETRIGFPRPLARGPFTRDGG